MSVLRCAPAPSAVRFRATRRAALLAIPITIGLCAALEPVALAQGSFQSSPLGGRSALMGGTGVALGSDGAAPFLNPATMTRIEDTSLAFSSNFFRYTRRTVDRWEQPGPVDAARFAGVDLGDTSATEEEFVSVPDSTCFFFQRGPMGITERGGPRVPETHKIGFCVGKVEQNGFLVSAESFSGASSGLGVSRSRSQGNDWSRWSVGPSWAYNFTDKIAVGASLHIARARYGQSLSVATILEDMGAGTATSSTYQAAISASSWDILAYLGVTYRASEVVTLGLSLRTPSVHLADHFRATYSAGDGSGADVAATRAWTGEGSFVARSPTRVAVGVAAEWKRLRLELDGFVYPGIEDLASAEADRDDAQISATGAVSRSKSKISFVEEANPVVNVGLGAELFMTEKLSLLLGVLTDFSAVPPLKGGIEGGSRLFYDRKSAVHASLGLTSYTDYGDIIFGVQMNYAAGQMGAVNAFVSPVRLDPVYYSEIGGMFILAGRVNLRTLTGAARAVGDAVEGASPAGPMEKPTEPMRKPSKKE